MAIMDIEELTNQLEQEVSGLHQVVTNLHEEFLSKIEKLKDNEIQKMFSTISFRLTEIEKKLSEREEEE